MKDNNEGGGGGGNSRSAKRMGLGGMKGKREKILLEKQTLTSTIR